MLWPVYSQVSAKLVPGEPLFFRGRVSLREEDDTKMVLERVLPSRSAKAPRPPARRRAGKRARRRQARGRTPPKGQGSCSSGAAMEGEQWEKLQLLFSIFEGETPCWCGPPIPAAC